ncbi:hypothetical protein [Sharpea azabuensis]|uniref:hypothetical protein n=1 Tax=Sharpea azabuensis TaxID=322505 RepID=UPI001567F70B|nr:hypothetical protein [Sharpea azabuensis]
MRKYYKLYKLKDNKLYSRFGNGKCIELNKAYFAQDSHYKLCFANINHILDYAAEHGEVVCDVKPIGKVIDSLLTSKVESESEGIIASNPRFIYSPEFIEELTLSGDEEAWSYVSDESYVIGAIEYSKGGMCYDVNLNYKLCDSLYLLLLKTYDNDKLNEWFTYCRQRFNFNNIFKMIKKDQNSKNIVINAWNTYAPSKKSKLLRFINYFANGFNKI